MDNFEYRIIGAFDTETTNISSSVEGFTAFPVLYQLGELNCSIEELTVDNCHEKIKISMFRHAAELYEKLDSVLDSVNGYTAVLLVHNLGFDVYSLAPWLESKHCGVLAKTARKPITITVLDDNGKPRLVFLDTLGLFMKSLSRMGKECGMPKAVGDWDYMRIRTPETPLTAEEEHYAKRDIETLLCYVSYFLGKNPDISPGDIGRHIVTKTGIVRHKRMKHLGSLKGKGLNRTINQYWNFQNRQQKPKTDNELFTMHACTRGGFTFCAKNHASEIFEAGETHAITAFDATSMHPSAMVSHMYPVDFKPATIEELELAAQMVELTTIERILKKWARPFNAAFNALFSFENLRPKAGSMYEKEGIYPLASARIKKPVPVIDSDNESADAFELSAHLQGYHDAATNPKIRFGKLESADYCELWLTELTLWEVFQAYDFDSYNPIGGYITLNFRKPTDLSIASVMRFYQAKNALKEVMTGADASKLEGFYPDSFVSDMKAGKASESEAKEYYQLAKADLNALFGIEATNEARQDFEITNEGLKLTGAPGMDNYPRNPKCWYQFGQRIVGWSRIAQHMAMNMVYRHCDAIICGDTDSFKLYLPKDNIGKVTEELAELGKAIDFGKKRVCERIERRYPDLYDELPSIGHYVSEGSYDAFSASWNKSYIGMLDGKLHMTLAGVPTSRGEYSIEQFGQTLIDRGADFASVASLLIGYNVTFDYSLTKLNGKKHPLWCSWFAGEVTDYLGNTSEVFEPMALAIYPEPKTIGSTEMIENVENLIEAIKNNPDVNQEPVMLLFENGELGVIE